MNLATELAVQFNSVYLAKDWVSTTSIKTQLSDLRWEEAVTKISLLNSIADLARHLDYYIKGIIGVLEGGSLDMHDAESFSFAPIRSQKEWEECMESLWNHASEFSRLVAGLSPQEMEAPFANAQYGSNYHNINAMIQHIYYHLGQIVVIKKLIRYNASVA